MAVFGLPEVGVKLVAKGVDKFKSQMRDVEQSQSKLTQGIIKNHKKIGLAMAGIGAAILGVGALSIKAASDVEEMTSKFDVVFGEMSDQVKDWAEVTAKAMGRSRFAMMGMAATIQDTFLPMGFASDTAAEMATTLTELAIDVGSFNNKLDEDVIRDFQSALVGNHETVRKYGIVITEARLQQEILNQGWVENKEDITAAMQVQARMNLILAGTTDAQGDAIRTADSFANRTKALNAQMTELKVLIGQGLLPIITPFIEKLTAVVTKITEWMQRNPELANTLMGIAFAVGAILVPLGILITMSKTALVGIIALGKGFITMAAQAVTAAGALIVKAVGQLWAWASAVPFAGIGIGLAGAAAITASIFAIKAKMSGLAYGGETVTPGRVMVGERGPEILSLPAGAQVQPISNNNTFNVTENYARPEEPQSSAMTLYALRAYVRT